MASGIESLKPLFISIGTYIVGPILLGAATFLLMKMSDIWKKRKLFHSIQMSTEKNDKVQELLTEIRILLQADRAYLSMFHNGTKYVDGSELLKKSRTNESVAPGVTFDAQFYQNVNVSLVPDEMKLVTADGPSYSKVDELKDGKFKRMLVSRGIKAIARCAVRKNNDIIGFLGIDYNTDKPQPANISDLCKYAGIVEQVLSTYR